MISFTADRIELGSAIGKASQGLPSRPHLPVYAGLLFTVEAGIVHITASDGEVTFVSALPVHYADAGSFILPGKVVTEIFRYLAGGEVRFEFDGKQVTITAGRALYTFPALDGKLYPAWLPSGRYLGTMDGAEFAAAVRAVAPAAERTGHRPDLRTVCLALSEDQLTMVATDSYRLAWMIPDWTPALSLGDEPDPPEQILVPSWVMERFARVADEEVAVGWDGALVSLATQGLQVIARQISGKYLPWKGLLSLTPDRHATVDPQELSRAVKAASLLAGPGQGIILEFSDNVHVRARGEGSCDEVVGTDYCGDASRFILGTQMLLDGLAGCTEEAVFSFTANPVGPVFIEDEGFRYMMKPRVELKETFDQPAG
jgi:DNA polymerase-3 subunit beta